jgi:hypothetical protein
MCVRKRCTCVCERPVVERSTDNVESPDCGRSMSCDGGLSPAMCVCAKDVCVCEEKMCVCV